MTGIRRAAPADLDELLVLIEEFCTVDEHDFDPARIVPALRPLLDGDEYGQVWLGEAAYAVVTWGWSLESGGREALLDEIYVRDRGRGIGAALLARVLAEAAKAGALRLFLETESANARVRGFYARHGFAAEDSIWMSTDL
ncbi:GNAT family N-acetyltransferase [Hamadaea tsunoensis]|uniref:GNAT family N-acetyltransferase n=1 Tax=Hamadaea tsunoensis TaxID=53368 RepID=UPI000416C59F|nr:GNAT family N-acetyltransferase [Hamadaea tsunoensis]